MLVAIISSMLSCVATRIGVIRVPCSAKPDPGVTGETIILVVTTDTNSRFAVAARTQDVESFLVTAGLQRGPRPNELLPCVTSQ